MPSKMASLAAVFGGLICVGACWSQENPYEKLYLKSISQMSSADSAPDVSLPEPSSGSKWLASAAASKTCSQRCSTTCSKSCTTTRGCSSNCKVQTDGCGGGARGSSGGSAPAIPSDTIRTKERFKEPRPPRPSDSEKETPAPKKSDAKKVQFTAKVTAIVSGDTITCTRDDETEVTIRLAEIDAPDTGQPFCEASTDALSSLLLGEKVAIRLIDVAEEEGTFGQVYREGQWINKKMLEEGWARFSEEYSTDEELTAIESEAKKAKKGIWAEADSVASEDTRPLATPPTGQPAEPSVEYRVWKDATGKFQVKARLVRVTGNSVTLEREDGTSISVPLTKLSTADRDFLAKRK